MLLVFIKKECNLIIHNLLINYLNLKKESIQKELVFWWCFKKSEAAVKQMFFKISVLKNFAIFRGNICLGVSF